MKSESCSSSGAVGRARERAVEVRARRPQPRVRVRGLDRGARDDDQPPGHVLRLGLAREPQRRDLALGLVAVDAAEHEHRRAVAAVDRHDRDEEVRPSARVRRARHLQPAELLAGRGEVERAVDGAVRHGARL